MATPDAAAELHARLQTRALVDLAASGQAQRKATEDQTRELTALRADIGALRSDLAAQSRSSLILWADRNPWPAAFLAVAVLLGLAGQLPLLSHIATAIPGAANAAGS